MWPLPLETNGGKMGTSSKHRGKKEVGAKATGERVACLDKERKGKTIKETFY